MKCFFVECFFFLTLNECRKGSVAQSMAESYHAEHWKSYEARYFEGAKTNIVLSTISIIISKDSLCISTLEGERMQNAHESVSHVGRLLKRSFESVFLGYILSLIPHLFLIVHFGFGYQQLLDI